MGLEKVIFSDSVSDYFENLIYTLYDKGYFGFQDSANNYVVKLVKFIINDIHAFPHKITPKKLSHLGSHYIFYKSNARTTWYIFFEKKSNNYYISGILNNYSEAISELEIL